jgi:hypothetical protein
MSGSTGSPTCLECEMLLLAVLSSKLSDISRTPQQSGPWLRKPMADFCYTPPLRCDTLTNMDRGVTCVWTLASRGGLYERKCFNHTYFYSHRQQLLSVIGL